VNAVNLYEWIWALKAIIVVLVAIAVDRIINKKLRSVAAAKEMPANVVNGIATTIRLLIIGGVIAALLSVVGIPSEWFLGVSALTGTAIGFASTRTVGNLLAGLYVMATRSLRAGDYVRIGNIEGVVEEITITHTKIKTPTNNIVFISNQTLLDQNIINFYYGGSKNLYCYTFEVGFDHSLPSTELEKIFEEVIEKYAGFFPKKPEYSICGMDRLGRRYVFYLYFDDPKKIFVLQPRFLGDLVKRWDEERIKAGSP